jgi:hypothetical protein
MERSQGARSVSDSWKLREAAAGGHLERVQEELSRMSDVNDGGSTGWTALHKACDRGRGEVIHVLLEAGANPDLKTKAAADTALHLAAAKGHAEVCNELIKAGADVHAVNKIGWTPMHAAMYSDKLDVARILTRAGASAVAANSSGVTPNLLAHRSDPHQVEAIIETSRHLVEVSVEESEPRDYQAIRESRAQAARRDTDIRMDERRKLRAENQQLKQDRNADRAEREMQLQFALDASLRKNADVLDPGLDYHNLTREDVPDTMVRISVAWPTEPAESRSTDTVASDRVTSFLNYCNPSTRLLCRPLCSSDDLLLPGAPVFVGINPPRIAIANDRMQ